MAYSSTTGSDWSGFMTQAESTLSTPGNLSIVDTFDSADGEGFAIGVDDEDFAFTWDYGYGNARGGIGYRYESMDENGASFKDSYGGDYLQSTMYQTQNVNYHYYSNTDFSWIWGVSTSYPDSNTNDRYSYCALGTSIVDKAWDYNSEYGAHRYALYLGGTNWNDGGTFGATCGIQSYNDAPSQNGPIGPYMFGGVTSSGEWKGTERNVVQSWNVSNLSDGVPLGTFEGWGYDPNYQDREHLDEVDTGTGKLFTYFDKYDGNFYNQPAFFQHS
jgi:hypothetical protein